MKMREVKPYAKLVILCGLVALLKDSSIQVKADVSLTDVPRECTDYSATGDCLQLIFSRYGDSNIITAERFKEFLTNIGLGRTATDHDDHNEHGAHHDHYHHETDPDDHNEHGAHHDHYHHEGVLNHTNSTTSRPIEADNREFIVFGDNHTTDDHIQKCLPPASLLAAVGLHPSDTLNSSRFLALCPILLQQIDVHACTPGSAVHQDEDGIIDQGGEDDHETRRMREVWAFSIVAITVISLASLLCILTVPCIQGHPVGFQRLLSCLVALAVGTLSGDAILHLIPHSFIPHNHQMVSHGNTPEINHHGDEDHTHNASFTVTEQQVIFKGLVVLVGIFAFFIFEQILQYLSERSGSRGRKQEYRSLPVNQEDIGFKLARQVEQDVPRASSSSKENSASILPYMRQGTDKNLITSPNHPNLPSSCQYSELESVGHSEKAEELQGQGRDIEIDSDGQYTQRSHSHGHTHGHKHGHSHAFVTGEGISSLAWVVVLGDALHNLCDGLVVGSAFVDSLTGGISTAIAIMCHEIPHELGDFAVMLKAGMSIKQALAVQGVSSVLAFVGMAVGIAVGNISSVSAWMFALAAGMFLYIALVDLVPEMVESTKSSNDSRMLQFGLQAVGVALGCGIMLFIALSEEALLVLIGG